MFKQVLYLLVFSILIAIEAIGQNRIVIKQGDTSYMYKVYNEWLFRDNLPDGHYTTYDDYSRDFISQEINIINGKKNGVENRYFSTSTEKYAIINWKDGKKNGTETHFNGNGTIDYILSFKNNELDGPIIDNWSEGERNYSGYYKNGYRDSIWTYYELESDTGYAVYKKYKYVNGIPYLYEAWNIFGKQTVFNGTGDLYGSFDTTNATHYVNGQKNGRLVDWNTDGIIVSSQYYKDGLLINDTTYFDDGTLKSISEYSYTTPKIDTSREWIDTYITECFFNNIEYNFTQLVDGYWVDYYSNKNKKYEGSYQRGKRIGTWYWCYPNGNKRMIVDYAKNKWQHFDTTGKLVSKIRNEYLTNLTEHDWYLTQSLLNSVVTLYSSQPGGLSEK